ncbi:MAG: hypothetical protein QNJ74_05895 [Trichodesmium sp. MO_231.B1]|nr:hypothetical protein [Trichodesmium sp. MO_231.B1]
MITQSDNSVVALIPKKPGYSKNAAGEAIQALEAIARWTNILNLKSSKSSIKPHDVEMEIIKYGHYNFDDEDDIITPSGDSENFIANPSEQCLDYKYVNGMWEAPFVKVRLTNHSNQKLFCSVL